MTTPTVTNKLGISIVIQRPTINIGGAPAYTPGGSFVGSFREQVSSYTHTHMAMGGYFSARFTIRDRQLKLEDWLAAQLGSHVEIFAPSLDEIWEGFVNQIDLSLGSLFVVRGPLLDVGNRVRVTYSTVDTAFDPPVVGLRVTTAIAEDADSQGKYGIIEKSLSGGGMQAGGATQVRDTFLEENREPRSSQKLGEGAGQQVMVHCLGYVHWLEAFTYSNTGVTGTINLSTKIGNVLDADPNDLFASANADITANTLAVPDYDDDQRTGWSVVKGLVARGDANDDRYTFGVYNGRRAVYAEVPTTTAYQQRLGDPGQRVETPSGTLVRPWNVLPARWLFLPDFLVGRTQPTDMRLDPRHIFIESVKFTAPYDVQIKGGRVETLPQKLAKMGLAGVGA